MNRTRLRNISSTTAEDGTRRTSANFWRPVTLFHYVLRHYRLWRASSHRQAMASSVLTGRGSVQILTLKIGCHHRSTMENGPKLQFLVGTMTKTFIEIWRRYTRELSGSGRRNSGVRMQTPPSTAVDTLVSLFEFVFHSVLLPQSMRQLTWISILVKEADLFLYTTSGIVHCLMRYHWPLNRTYTRAQHGEDSEDDNTNDNYVKTSRKPEGENFPRHIGSKPTGRNSTN